MDEIYQQSDDEELLEEEIKCCQNDDDIMIIASNIYGTSKNPFQIFKLLKILFNQLQVKEQYSREDKYNLLVKELAIENQKLRECLKKSEVELDLIISDSGLNHIEIDSLKKQVQSLNDEIIEKSRQLKLLQGDVNEISQQSMDELNALEEKLKTSLSIITDRKKLLALRRQQASDNKFCVICLNKQYCILLKPCGHVCVCEDCITQINKCPIDRKQIIKSKKVFLS